MNILLVNPYFKMASIRPPLGLAYLASVLDDRHEIKILDLSLYADPDKTLIQTLKSFEPHMVGITCYTPSFSSTMNISLLTKKYNPNISVVVGGPHPTILPETCLNENVDFVIRGEGELTFPELTDSLEKNKVLDEIKGLSFKKNGKIIHNEPRPYIKDLDSLPFPSRHYLELEKYVDYMEGIRFTTILSSRGCPYHCIYCCKNVVGTRWVSMSPERVMLEIKEIINKYKFNHIHFHEELFTFKKEWVKKICELLISNNLNIKWSCNSRVDMVTKELLYLMKKAGCVHINYGVESGDEGVLKSLKKGITLEQVKKAFKDTHDAGIPTSAYFMIGVPEDTHETIQKTIDLALELDPQFVQFSIATPYPGTELWDIAEREGMFKNQFTWDDLLILNEKPLFDTKNLTKEEIFEFLSVANKTWQQHVFRRNLHKNRLYLIKKIISQPKVSLSQFINIYRK